MIKDIRSNLFPQLEMNANIVSNTDTFGTAIDMADFEDGFLFTFFAQAFTDGVYTPGIQESDDVGFSSPGDVEQGRLIGTPANEAISAVAAGGDELGSLGAFGTKRFLRLKITSTVVTTGAQIVSTSHKVGEILPVKE